LTRPLSRSADSSTFAPALNPSRSPTLTSAVIVGNGLMNPRFGSRRWRGVWPPSKWGLKPRVRAYWPFWPRPAVLPKPDPTPRPRRTLSRVAPAGFASLLSVSAIVDLLDAHQVHDLLDRAAKRGGVTDHDRAARSAEAQAVNG